MKINVEQKDRTFLGKLGIVFMVVGIMISYHLVAIAAFGLGLTIADTVSIVVEREKKIESEE